VTSFKGLTDVTVEPHGRFERRMAGDVTQMASTRSFAT